MSIETATLVLRPWTGEDRQPFAEMSVAPAAMGHLLPLAGRDGSDRWIDRLTAHLAEHGFCFWALEAKKSDALVGAVGVLRVPCEARFVPAVKIGWRVT